MFDAALAMRILNIVFPIFAIVAIGFGYGKFRHQDMAVVNTLIMDVFVPILVFIKLAQSDFTLGSYLPLALGGVVVILGSGLLTWLGLRLFPAVQPKTFVPPMMFSNATNIGIPLQIFAFGEAAMPAALILMLIFNLLHFSLGIYILDHQNRWYHTLKQPILISCILAICFKFSGLHIPQFVSTPLDMLADICVPLMLFSLGMRLITADFGALALGICAGITAPAVGILTALGAILLIPMPFAHTGNLLLFSILPPAIMNFILAEKYQQEPQKVASIVMIGNLMAVITIPLALAFILPYFSEI